jgi:hypothetical protein
VYAISQNTDPHGLFQEGNQLHILAVGSDGTLSEPNSPIIFAPGDVPGTAHPQGIAVVPGVGGKRHDHRNQPEADHRGGSPAASTNPTAAQTDTGIKVSGSGDRQDLSDVVNLLFRDRR